MGSSYIFLANLVMIANERHNARLAPRINGTVWPQSATQRARERGSAFSRFPLLADRKRMGACLNRETSFHRSYTGVSGRIEIRAKITSQVTCPCAPASAASPALRPLGRAIGKRSAALTRLSRSSIDPGSAWLSSIIIRTDGLTEATSGVSKSTPNF